MTRRHVRTISAVAIIAALGLSPIQAQDGSAAIKPAEVIKLFDGKSLSNFEGWLVDHHSSDPERVFTVVDQIDGAPAIRVSGQVWGGLLTKQAYRDYRLIVEFRWGGATWGNRKDRARDSGVLLHAQGKLGNTGKDFNGPWLRSIEFQIIEDRLGFRGSQDVESPGFEWTRIEAVVEGGKLTYYVNGKLVNAASDSSFKDGRIMIQSEGAEIYF